MLMYLNYDKIITRYTCDKDDWGDFKIIHDTLGENCSKLYDFDDLVIYECIIIQFFIVVTYKTE